MHARIAAHEVWIVVSRLLVYLVIGLGQIDRWRRQQLPGNELFFGRLEERLRKSMDKARASIERERDMLRNAAAQHEGV
jgi:hypothetical protein